MSGHQLYDLVIVLSFLNSPRLFVLAAFNQSRQNVSYTYNCFSLNTCNIFFDFLFLRLYLDAKGRHLDIEKLFAYLVLFRSFLSM